MQRQCAAVFRLPGRLCRTNGRGMDVLAQMGCFVAPLVFMFLNMASPVGAENSVYPVRASLLA